MASGIDKNRLFLECVKSKKPIEEKLTDVKRHLDQGADVNTTDDYGNTPLHLATNKPENTLSKLLLEYGANVNAQNIYGNTPLYNAVFSRDISIVELLLNKGADVNSQAPNDDTPLHIAVKYRMIDIVELLLKKEADVNALTTDNYTPLHLASELLKLNKGVDVNALTKECCTALPLVARSGVTSIVDLLLNKGVDVNALTKECCTALHLAARSGATSIVDLLLNNGAEVNSLTTNSDTPLHEAVRSGVTSVVELLLNKGADVNAQAIDGSTPLHESVRNEKISIVRLLIKNGAYVNAKKANGRTALHEAAVTGNASMVDLLLKSGADVNVSANGYLPLHAAVGSKELSVVALLLSNGAHVNDCDAGGYTPLHLATSNRRVTTNTYRYIDQFTFKDNPGSWTVEELLLNEGANVNAVAMNGDTPLYLAALVADTFIVELLLKRGARVNQQNTYKVTPLHAAVQSGDICKVELLLNNGANVNAQTITGNTPLHLAVRKEDSAIVMLLVKHGANVMRKNKTGDKALSYSLLFSHKEDDKIISLLQNAEQKARDSYLLKSYQSRDPLHIFQRCDQHMKSNCTLGNGNTKYLKSCDTSGLPGQLYEINMLSLVYIRALNNHQIEHDILLGTNINSIGSMDDICLRYQVNRQHKPVVLFVQLKHREDPENGKLTHRALWSDSGDFSLRKYFESYLMIREQFRVCKDNPMFEGDFCNVDCCFVLFTSAKESIIKKVTKNKINEIVHNLIITKENSEPFQYSYDDSDLNRLTAVDSQYLNSSSSYDERENAAIDFFNCLWFYTSQAKQDKVEHIVKFEINKYYNNNKCENNFRFDIHSNAIFSKVHHDIQEWWKLKEKAPYLNRSTDFFSRAKLLCLADASTIVLQAANYLKCDFDLEFHNHFEQRDTSLGTLETFNEVLSKMFRIINDQNLLVTMNTTFKNKIINLLVTDDKFHFFIKFHKVLQNSEQSQNLNKSVKHTYQCSESNNVLLRNKQFEYSKRTGTSEIAGILFRMKMLCLILLRVLNYKQTNDDPLLGTKIQGISFMNDICLRYREKSQQKPTMLFLQIVHREDPEKGKLSEDALWCNTGDYSLWKFFEGYLEISKRFRVANNDPMFKGNFQDSDCYFVLYTSGNETITKKKTQNKLNKSIQDLIGTKMNTDPFQYDYNDADIEKLTKKRAMDQINKLGAVFLEYILSKVYNPNILAIKLIARYHVAIAREILRQSDVQPLVNEYRVWRFRSEFFDSELEYLVAVKNTLFKMISSERSDNNKILNECEQNIKRNHLRQKLESLEIKLPLSFGNSDMTFRGNKVKVHKRMKVLADNIINLLESSKGTNIIEINDDDVGPGKNIEQGMIDINGGIGGAVGNLLVLDTDSNMLLFDLENEALPHNAALLLAELKNDRYSPFNEDLKNIRFNFSIDFCRYSFKENEYDKKQAKDFLNKFWFYCNQCKEEELYVVLKSDMKKVYSENKVYKHVSDIKALHSLNDIQKWWLQTKTSPYLSRAGELFERAELADIYNLLQTIINFMYISNTHRIDFKLKRVRTEKSVELQQFFKKISGKLLNLFDPQFEESFHFRLPHSDSKFFDTFTLTIRIDPDIDWVALTLITECEDYYKHRIVVKASRISESGQAKDGFIIFEQAFFQSSCMSSRDCLKNVHPIFSEKKVRF